MGLTRIDESSKRLSPEEWNRMMIRRHHIQRLLITLAAVFMEIMGGKRISRSSA